MAPLASRAMLTPFFSSPMCMTVGMARSHVYLSYMILRCFPGYHRSKAACFFVHCKFSGSVFNIDIGRVRAKL